MKKSSQNKINKTLWEKISKLSTGTENQKIKSIKLIFDNYNNLPIDCISMLESLAKQENPKKMRLITANLLLKKPVSIQIHQVLLKILIRDTDTNIKKIVNKIIVQRIGRLTSTNLSIISSALNPTIFDSVARLGRMRIDPKIFDSVVKLQTFGADLAKLQKSNSFLNYTPPKPLLDVISLSNQLNQQMAGNIVKNFPSFYRPTELEIVSEPVKEIKQSKTQELITKLKNCGIGNDHWKEYENICEEILVYCLSPPLDEPLYQKYTENHIHRRDIVFLISHGLGAYWQFLTLTYGEGIIFDCKNYNVELPENEIRITEKYLDRKKLTRFGIIISRKGFSDGAKIAQKQCWEQHENLIISLTDEDLIKMLELKDQNKEPWIVMDHITKKFRLGL